jgi:hypothetical protein
MELGASDDQYSQRGGPEVKAACPTGLQCPQVPWHPHSSAGRRSGL